MNPTQVHPTAVVENGAEIGPGCVVGPYAVIGPKVRIGAGNTIGAHAVLEGNTLVGQGNTIHAHAVVGGAPQDLKYRGEDTRLEIGDHNMIREGVTINIGTELGGGITRVGSRNVLMANAHVAHDCILGDHIILANNVMLAGHVRVQTGAILNGGVGVHHFTTIGAYAYVGGLSRITRDVTPYMIVEGHPSKVRGVNVIGLRRARFSDATVRAIKEAYKLVYRADQTMRDALDRLKVDFADVEEVQAMVRFLEATESGRQGRQGEDRERGLAP